MDAVEATFYCDELIDTIFDHDYSTDQIFNTEETSLNYKMFLAAKANREAPGVNMYEECVTVLTRANASRSFQLSSLFIGKLVKPCALKNYDFQSSPVEYKYQKSAWMNVQLFQD